jgi:molybdopterin/thiamine biosynthesis adenylyltransferase
MGGLSAEQLVRLGVGHIKIADFDKFERHNLSRQAGSTFFNTGVHKAAVLGRYFMEINPELKLEVFTDGVQPENVNEFISGANAVIDGIDYTQFYHSVVLHRAAQGHALCIVNPQAIGFGVSVLVFGPKTVDIETYVGLPAGLEREVIERFRVPMDKFAPYLPKYADLEIARQAAVGEINIPNIIMSQHLGTAIAVSEVVMILLGRVEAPQGPNPRTFILDLQDRKFEVTG